MHSHWQPIPIKKSETFKWYSSLASTWAASTQIEYWSNHWYWLYLKNITNKGKKTSLKFVIMVTKLRNVRKKRHGKRESAKRLTNSMSEVNWTKSKPDTRHLTLTKDRLKSFSMKTGLFAVINDKPKPIDGFVLEKKTTTKTGDYWYRRGQVQWIMHVFSTFLVCYFFIQLITKKKISTNGTMFNCGANGNECSFWFEFSVSCDRYEQSSLDMVHIHCWKQFSSNSSDNSVQCK